MQDEGFGTDETRLGHDDSVAGDAAAGAIGGALGGLLGTATSVLDEALRSSPERKALTDQEALIDPPRGPLPELPDGGPLPEPLEMPRTWQTEPGDPAVRTGLIEPGFEEH